MMRFWPFNIGSASAPPESATDLAKARLIDQARRPAPADPAALAVIEAAVGLVARCMSAAEVSGPGAPLMTRPFLAIAARSVLEQGAFVAIPAPTAPVLHPAADWNIQGRDPDPASWIVKADLPAPDGVRSITIPASEAVVVIWNADRKEPWRGRSPVERAEATAAVASASERSMDRELAFMPRWFGRVRERLTPAQHAELADLLSRPAPRAGGLSVMGGDGGHWTHTGPDPTATVTALRRAAAEELCASLGVPPELILPGSEGAARREAWRVFGHSLLRPLAQALEAEVSLKAAEVDISVAGLAYADLQGRARSYSQLTRGGMDPDRAARIVGL